MSDQPLHLHPTAELTGPAPAPPQPGLRRMFSTLQFQSAEVQKATSPEEKQSA